MGLWQRARLGMLPDVLTVWEIACLWTMPDQPEDALALAAVILRAIDTQNLKACGVRTLIKRKTAYTPWQIAVEHMDRLFAELFPDPDSPPLGSYRLIVHRDDFAAWLSVNGVGLPTFWFGGITKQSKGGRAAHTVDARAKQLACQIAEATWREYREGGDPPERIGSVTSYIRDQLRAEHGEYALTTIKGWIADFAPPGAKRSGRPPKTP